MDGGGVVVRGHHGELLSPVVLLLQGTQGHPLGRLCLCSPIDCCIWFRGQPRALLVKGGARMGGSYSTLATGHQIGQLCSCARNAPAGPQQAAQQGAGRHAGHAYSAGH